MSNEIKFRAWNGEKMTYGNDADSFPIVMMNLVIMFPEGWELMQYTNIKDRNAKEIYEEDIVDVYPVNHFRHSTKKRNIIKRINGGLFLKSLDKNILGHAELCGGHRIEIIGNGYENSELLNA